MMNRFMIASFEDGRTIRAGDHLCDWLFYSETIEIMRRLDDRKFVDMLLDFRSVFPDCSQSLVKASEKLRSMLGHKCRVRAIIHTGEGLREERILCLDDGQAPILDNSL